MTKDLRAKCSELLEAYATAWPLSGTFLVAKDGEIILKEAYGMANMEHEIPNTPTTRFLIGSITKPFTAVGIMMLYEQGLLHPEDTLHKYLPDYPATGDKITIHHLLTHTSGIPSYTLLPEFSNRLERLPLSHEEVINLFKNAPLEFEPGERGEYSNSGYYLLGVIIEKITGKSYGQFLDEYIFKPLHMSNSGLYHQDEILANRASGYELSGDGFKNAGFAEMSIPFAAGAIYSTVEDLLIWNEALHKGQLVSEDSLQLLFTPDKMIDGSMPYGYGFFITDFSGHKQIGHDGGIKGFFSQLRYYPEEKVTIILLINLLSNIWRMGDDLASIMLGHEYTLPTRPERATIDTSIYSNYVGIYESSYAPGHTLTVTTEEGNLYFQRNTDRNKFEVYPLSETLFSHILIDEKYRFKYDEEGNRWVWGYKRKI